MTIFPNAKINIGLRIVSRRDDGFHNIETIFYPVGVKDICEFVLAGEGSDSDELTTTGHGRLGNMRDNLVIRAVNLLRLYYDIPPLKIHLHKVIPIGAGLGGGSANATFMIRYLDRYFRLGIGNERIKELAFSLGSDCPFFVENKAMYAKSRGELMEPSDLDLSAYYLAIINPGIHIDTGKAYRAVGAGSHSGDLREYVQRHPGEWRNLITNDFEDYVFQQHPLIKNIKDELYNMGAVYSSMSGSGSSVFALFTSDPPHDIFPSFWKWFEKPGQAI